MNIHDETTHKNAERSLVLRISEADYRRYRSRATARGLKNPEFLRLLLDLEAEKTDPESPPEKIGNGHAALDHLKKRSPSR